MEPTDTLLPRLPRDLSENSAVAHALAIYRAALDAVRANSLTRAALTREGDRLLVGAQTRHAASLQDSAGSPRLPHSGSAGASPSQEQLELSLGAFAHIYVVGAGKAATGMAQAVEERLGTFLTEGVVVTKHGHGGPTRTIKVMEAGHPIPDEGSLAAGRAIHALAGRAGKDDLVLCLISGGASALMELPQEGVTLDDLRAATDLLLRAGADIEELNAVRACLSQLKAGGLARAAAPARVICLVLSDVLGSPLHVIGSGPCVETPVNPQAAQEVLVQYGVAEKVPASVTQRLAQLTPSPLHPFIPSPFHVLIGDIWTALYAAREAAIQRGLRPAILTGFVQGEAREAAKLFGGIARDLPRTQAESGIDCYLAGGETTVTVRGQGMGGRSQEIACAAAPILAGVPDVALLAAGTDGTDGPTDAAGGLVTGETLAKAAGSVEAALRENNAYPWLEAAGALLKTGPTHSNVGDLVIVVSTNFTNGHELSTRVQA